ncbi:MAG TPA: chitobiase/beta-hexosaminidase C-terminal domain-containing protein, partial [Verrucomicrobiae bacterium]|nr:chitobiase/beta-hexosaminidase C-terminal domain-containing protein [Verrucomicrobiae bacterium]
VTLQPPDTNAVLYYTLDGSLPTTNSARYTGPFILSSSAIVTANAFEANYVNSVAVSGTFTIVPPLYTIFAPTFLPNGSFEMQYWAPTNQTYILQSSTDLVHWTPVATNVPASAPFTLIDPGAAASPYRFYRVVAP